MAGEPKIGSVVLSVLPSAHERWYALGMQDTEVSTLPWPLVDRGVHLLFDWVVESPGSITKPIYRLFSEPISADRSIDDTSMWMSEQLAAPQGFEAHSVHAFYGTMSRADRELFRERYSLTLWILGKNMWRCPLVAIPFQGLTFPWVNKEPEGYPYQPNNLEPFPRYVPAQCQFYMELTGRPVELPSGLRFLPAINGYLDRGVQ